MAQEVEQARKHRLHHAPPPQSFQILARDEVKLHENTCRRCTEAKNQGKTQRNSFPPCYRPAGTTHQQCLVLRHLQP